MRKILRNMYKNDVPKRYRRKSRVNVFGKFIPGTWLEWKAGKAVA